MSKLLSLLWFIPLVIVISVGFFVNDKFDKDCFYYLQAAVNAENVESAKTNLKMAIDYIEKDNMTRGHTSIVYKRERTDMGAWYHVLKTAYKNLENIPSDLSLKEQQEVILNFREEIRDFKKTSQGYVSVGSVAVPTGISFYPYFGLFILALAISFLMAFYGILTFIRSEQLPYAI